MHEKSMPAATMAREPDELSALGTMDDTYSTLERLVEHLVGAIPPALPGEAPADESLEVTLRAGRNQPHRRDPASAAGLMAVPPLRSEDVRDIIRRMRQLHDSAMRQVSLHVREAPETLTTGEASAALGVSINTVKKWARSGLLREATMAGSHMRIPRREVKRLADLNRRLAQTSTLGSDGPMPDELTEGRGALPWQR